MDGGGTYRHDGLLSHYRRCPVRGGRADSSSGTSQDCISGGIGAPVTSLLPVIGLSSGEIPATEPVSQIQRQLNVNSRSAASLFQCDGAVTYALTSAEKFPEKDTPYGASAPCSHLHGGDDRAPRRLLDCAGSPALTTQPGNPGAAAVAAGSAGVATGQGQRPPIAGTLRQQALDEILNDIGEWRTASHPALRAFWRKLAIHDIRRFRRDYLQPERASFEAAVARQQSRRAA